MNNQYTTHYDGQLTLEFLDDLHVYLLGNRQVYGVTGILDVINKPQLNAWKMRKAMEFVKENIVEHEWTNEKLLDEALKEASKASQKVSGAAANIGTMIHQQLEHYINSQINNTGWEFDSDHIKNLLLTDLHVTYTEEEANQMVRNLDAAVKSFHKWEEKHEIEWLAAEKKVLSKQHYYAGTYDGKARVDGKLSMIDFKCVKKLYRPYLLQASAYAKADEEEYGEKIEHIYILKIPKEMKQRLPRVSVMEAEGEEIDELFDVFISALKLKKWADEFKL